MTLTASTPETRRRNNPIVSTPLSRAENPKVWLATKCDECGWEADRLVTVGEADSYECSSATICRPCLVAALKALDGAP